MTHENTDKDPGGQTSVPPTLDSFDPLRDAETLLEDGTAQHEESGSGHAKPSENQESAAPGTNERGPEDTNEVDARSDAG